MRQYGYMRVSSKEQNVDRQYAALSDFGIIAENIFTDKQSGMDFKRGQYRRLVYKKLKPGDLLVVKSIDRLGRNYEEILHEWAYITKSIGADIAVIDMPLLDTRRTTDLTGTFISDIVLQILSYVAQNERESLRQRQAEGIIAAKGRGVRFGRPQKEIPFEFFEVYKEWKLKEVNRLQAQERLGVTKMTFYRLVWKFEREGVSAL